MNKNKESSLYSIDLDDSSLNQAYATTSAFFAILGEWMVLFLTCSIALFFVPLSPSFTLHSTTSTVLDIANGNNFTVNIGIEFLTEDSNTIGSTVLYDSLHLSLFHRQKNLSAFSLPEPLDNEPANAASTQETKFCNVSMMVDEWKIANNDDHSHGKSCGFAYLDLHFSADARYMQPMWPAMKDKLEGHCGELKVEMCSSDSSIVVNSFLASCDVYSDLVSKIRIVLFGMLVFLLVFAVVVPLLLEHFFCSATFS